MQDNDKLDRLLDSWESEFEPDQDLAFKVRINAVRQREAARSRLSCAESIGEWLRLALCKPIYATGFAMLFILVGLGASRLMHGFKQYSDQMTLTYRLSIDPLYRMQAVAGVRETNLGLLGGAMPEESEPVLLAGLGWLQGELNLSNSQYALVSEIHSDYERSFDQLFTDLLTSHSEYQTLDRQRRSSDVIDYLQFYELLQKQKRLREESLELTSELLEKVSEIITPEQRGRYRRMIEQVYPDGSEYSAESRDV